MIPRVDANATVTASRRPEQGDERSASARSRCSPRGALNLLGHQTARRHAQFRPGDWVGGDIISEGHLREAANRLDVAAARASWSDAVYPTARSRTNLAGVSTRSAVTLGGSAFNGTPVRGGLRRAWLGWHRRGGRLVGTKSRQPFCPPSR